MSSESRDEKEGDHRTVGEREFFETEDVCGVHHNNLRLDSNMRPKRRLCQVYERVHDMGNAFCLESRFHCR